MEIKRSACTRTFVFAIALTWRGAMRLAMEKGGRIRKVNLPFKSRSRGKDH